MNPRYYICGQSSGGAFAEWCTAQGLDAGFYPEIADECVGVGWCANQQLLSMLPPTHAERFVVCLLTDDAALHADLAYSADNPDGFDWLEVIGDEVILHAA